MKYGRLLFISGLTICICFTFWQKGNLKYIWNDYWRLNKSFHYIKEGRVPRIPAIKEKVAKTDPEAAAIINYKLDYTLFSVGDEHRIEVLSRNILKFPNNQYFIYLLAWYAFDHLENGLDPAILLKLSNRLIELDGKNSNYFYLKAYALLCDRKNNNFDELTEIIKQANECEYFKDPHSLYIDRVISIAQKQGLHNHLVQGLDSEWPYNPFIKNAYETLIQYQNLLITEGEYAKADELSNLLNGMLKNNMYEPILNQLPRPLYGLGRGFGFWNLPQEVELQRKNLSRKEADQKRLQMCAIANPEKKIKAINKYYESDEKTQPYVIAVWPFVYFVRMASIFIFLTAILLAFSFYCKDNLKIKINKSGLVRFLIYSFVCFFSSQFLMFKSFLECQCCFSYEDIFLCRPLKFEDIKNLIEASRDIKSLFIVLFIPLAIVIFMGIIRFFKPRFDNLISRFICGIMISIPLGLVTMILQGHMYLRYFSMIVFVLFAFKYSFRKVTLRSIFKVFGGTCENEAAALRSDLLKLSAIAAVLCWLGFLCLMVPTKKSIEGEAKEYKYYTYSFTQDYEKAYQEILKRIDDVNLPVQNILRCIPLVKSGDLPLVMETLKKRKFPFAWKTEKYFRQPGSKDYDELTDRSISFLLRSAGRDQMPVIINYMDNPDDSWALVFRAKLGDKKVKDKLTNELNKAINEEDDPNKIEGRYHRGEARVTELITALASISGSDGAYALFKGYFDSHSVERISRCFGDGLMCTLSKDTFLKILNLFLEKIENEYSNLDNYTKHSALYPLRDYRGLYLDNETAKRILRLILQVSGNDGWHLETFGIEYYLTPEVSDLLIRGLQSDNENLRAWCIWQLKKINYKWNENELREIAEDKSWKVRANLTIIDKSLIKGNEPSAYVKLIKSM
jgi:hypothetical protein